MNNQGEKTKNGPPANQEDTLHQHRQLRETQLWKLYPCTAMPGHALGHSQGLLLRCYLCRDLWSGWTYLKNWLCNQNGLRSMVRQVWNMSDLPVKLQERPFQQPFCVPFSLLRKSGPIPNFGCLVEYLKLASRPSIGPCTPEVNQPRTEANPWEKARGIHTQ